MTHVISARGTGSNNAEEKKLRDQEEAEMRPRAENFLILSLLIAIAHLRCQK